MVKKNLEQQIDDLRDSIKLLEEALKKGYTGDKKYLKIISAQLRALVCSGSRSLNPLLIELAEKKGMPLVCYGPPDIDKNEAKHTLFKLSGRVIGLEPFSPAQCRYELKDWMNICFFVLENERYTPNDIIRTVAEKEGGAHYDKELSEKLIKLRTVIYSGWGPEINELERFLIQTAEIVIHFGKSVISSCEMPPYIW